MFVPEHPSCPWGFRDHMTTSAELLIRERSYFLVRHSVEICFQPYEQIEANQT